MLFKKPNLEESAHCPCPAEPEYAKLDQRLYNLPKITGPGRLFRSMGALQCFSAIFQKVNSFCDFLCASLDNKFLQQGSLSQGEYVAPR